MYFSIAFSNLTSESFLIRKFTISSSLWCDTGCSGRNYEQIEVRECLLSFFAESLSFLCYPKI